MRITNENYVDKAENVVKTLSKDKWGNFNLTTSKIRNILSMSAEIYSEVLTCEDETFDDSVNSKIEYLRVRLVYESGREKSVKELVKKAELLEILKEINSDKKNFILFNRYLESLVAFHKFYGGRD